MQPSASQHQLLTPTDMAFNDHQSEAKDNSDLDNEECFDPQQWIQKNLERN